MVEDELTLNDLQGIDAYSSQVLRELNEYSQFLSDEEFEATVDQCFTTVISSGEDVLLCENGDQTRVKKSNLVEFTNLVLEARIKEASL